jgi:hypothetical protein
MIVVMGAGAAAKLDLNPFEAMTTDHRQDRQPADRRHRIRQPRDAGRLCAWA